MIYKILKNTSLIFLLFLGFPLICLIGFGYFIIPEFVDYHKEVIGFGIVTFIAYNILLLSNKLKYNLLLIITFILSLSIAIKLTFYSHFNTKISASALFVLFETNAPEANEFIKEILSTHLLIIYFILLIPNLIHVLFKHQLKQLIKKDLSFILRPIVIPLLCIGLAVFSIVYKLKEENIVVQSFIANKEYNEFKKLFKNTLAKEKSPFIHHVKSTTDNETHVVIIGESTSKAHLQLYGYQRETNPLLSEIKDELTLFNNVITSDVHTISALNKILTLNNFEKPAHKENTSIVQLANMAGFETSWISNQRPIGFHESVGSLIGKAANNIYFTNTADYVNLVFDETIFPALDSVLIKPASKKLIFIQLMGTHTMYKKRYPRKFDQFNTAKSDLKFTHKKAINKTNYYDNAVLYNDWIIRTIIEKVRTINKKSYVLYFSDHGDEVYDEIDFAGHNVSFGTKSMYEVPFILWQSDRFKKETKFDFKKNRKYILEDFIYSFADINQIHFDGYQPEKSIFNKAFKEKKRIIYKGKDYDEKD